MIVPYLRGYGTTRFLSDETFRNGQQAAWHVDTVALMDALGIEKAVVAGVDWGARTADIVAALWPERCTGLVSVSGYLIGSQRPASCRCRRRPSGSGGTSTTSRPSAAGPGYERYRREFARLIWRTASPKWEFDDATFERSAAAFDNPDHVAIVIHNYRWRIGVADGEPEYDDLEQRLAEGPYHGADNHARRRRQRRAASGPGLVASKFSGSYSHRTIEGGVGHNLPQEAPQAFADAVLELHDRAHGEHL